MDVEKPGVRAELREYDDEISLIDLWLVLTRRLWLIGAVFLVCVLVGFGYHRLNLNTQNFTSTIEIGHYQLINQDGVLGAEKRLEAREDLIERIKQGIWPTVRQNLATEMKVPTEQMPELKITPPNEKLSENFIILHSEVPLERADEIQRIHKSLVEKVLSEHLGLLAPYKDSYEALINKAYLELDALEGEKKKRFLEASHALEEAKTNVENFLTFQSRLKRQLSQLKSRHAFLAGKQKDLEELFRESRSFELDRVINGEHIDNSLGMGLIFRGSLTTNLYQELSKVREQLLLGIEETRLKLEAELENAKMQLTAAERSTQTKKLELELFEQDFGYQVKQKQIEIKSLQAQQRQFLPTSALAIAVPSQVYRNGLLVMALSGVLGLMLGILSAFMVEFHQNAMRVAMQRKAIKTSVISV